MVFRSFLGAAVSVGLILLSPVLSEAKEKSDKFSSRKSTKSSLTKSSSTKTKSPSTKNSKGIKSSNKVKSTKQAGKKKSSSTKNVRSNKMGSTKQKKVIPPSTTLDRKSYVEVVSDRLGVSPGLEFWVMVHFRASSDKYLVAPGQNYTTPPPTIVLNPKSTVKVGNPLWPAPSSVKTNSSPEKEEFLAYEKPFSVLISVKAPFFWSKKTLEIPVAVKYYLCIENSNSCEEKTYQTNLVFTCDSTEPISSPQQKKVFTDLSLIPVPAKTVKDWHIQLLTSEEKKGNWMLRIAPSVQRILYPRKLQVIPAAPLQKGSVKTSYEVDVVPSGSSSAKDYNYQIRIAENTKEAPVGKFYLVSDLPWDEAREKRVLTVTASEERFWNRWIDKGKKANKAIVAQKGAKVSKAVVTQKIDKMRRQGSALLKMLIYAFLGGMILNLMPCVFPVLSIKILSMVSSQYASAKQKRSKLWGFNLGVIASFLTLATMILIFQKMGKTVGWGFQLQSPGFVTGLLIFFLAITANFWGWFEVPTFTIPMKQGISLLPDFVRSFISGCVATLVATPCTGPFLGVAMGFSLSQPPWVVLLIFLCIAMGMIAPMTILSWVPFLSVIMPKPGVWMENLKMFLSFPLLGTCVWLGFVWSGLLPNSIPVVLGLGCVCWLLCFWLFGRMQQSKNPVSYIIFASLCLLACGTSVFATKVSFGLSKKDVMTIADVDSSISESFSTKEKAGLTWITYTKNDFSQLLADKKNLFVLVTADWCTYCKAKEASMLYERTAIAAAMKEKKILPILADLTRENDEIQNFLKGFNRNGIPFAVVFPKENSQNPIVLPDGYSTKDLLKVFSRL